MSLPLILELINTKRQHRTPARRRKTTASAGAIRGAIASMLQNDAESPEGKARAARIRLPYVTIQKGRI